MAKAEKKTAEADDNAERSDDDVLPDTFPSRRRLPDTRQSVTHEFNISGHKGNITVGLYEDGRPGELFINMAKEGSTLSGLMDTVGILTSLSLQYGVPIEALARKFGWMRFEPSGWTPNKEIGKASSIIDYVFRWVGVNFSKEYRDEHTRRMEATALNTRWQQTEDDGAGLPGKESL